ncbi:glycosyltransferase family 2 protein [Candidatus Woesearchaeota archaeon]|nr:glycosyltransferase family 2 protein [Candidatus Woesearchaeota archaeon]
MIIFYLNLIITTIFLLTIISYYALIIIPERKHKIVKKFNSITIIIPAHNEEDYIEKCIKSVMRSEFNGAKQIIVVDDGSIDRTYEIASKFKITVLKSKHSGKALSINKALKIANGEVIAIVDADSEIQKDSLKKVVREIERKNVVAACCPVRVKNRNKFICMWLNIEQLYNSLIRRIFKKINANIVTPGPLSVYRKDALMEIGGFSNKGFSEDIDVAIRLIRKGHKIGFANDTIADTNMPHTVKGFLRQRTRFARGMINILKRHLRLNNTIVDIYTLPLFLFMYFQAVVMSVIMIYNISSGYYTYFYSKEIFFNLSVLKFFFEWFSIVGFLKYAYNVIIGNISFSFLAIASVASTLLTYPLYIYSIFKYNKKITLYEIVPFIFMMPFWLIVMMIYLICIPESFKKNQYNIWKKNE